MVVLSLAKSDLVQVAHAEEALSELARHAKRKAPDRPSRVVAPGFSAAPAVPAVDPTMRSVGLNDEQVLGVRKSISVRTAKVLLHILLLVGLGGAAALGWRWYGDAAQQISSVPLQPPGSSTQLVSGTPPIDPAFAGQAAAPVVDAANEETAQQSPSVAQTSSDKTVSAAVPTPSPEVTEQLQAMAHDLAGLRQQVGQLTAGHEQMRRIIARLQASEREARRRKTEPQVVSPPSKPLTTLAAPQIQQLSSTPTSETLPPPPRPPGVLR
jgi:hypothetical protein